MKAEAEEAQVYTGNKQTNQPQNKTNKTPNPLFGFVISLHIFGVQLQAVNI